MPRNPNTARPRSNEDNKSNDDKPVNPVARQYMGNITDVYRDNRGDHLHDGVDYGAPRGAKVYAVKDGKVESVQTESQSGGYGNYVRIRHSDNHITGYAHLKANVPVKAGQNVEKGNIIGYVNNTGHSFGDHLHFNVQKNGSWVDPVKYLDGATNLDTGEPAGGGAGAGDLADVQSTAKSAAFATFLQVPGILDYAESVALKGNKSLMNDKPLLPFIQQLCQASLRSFQSMPNGNFFAFFPDYFGGLNHRTPYWEISDLEILDATIELSDDALATHVYVVGDIANFDGVNTLDRKQTGGVITLFNAFQADFLSGAPAGANKKPKSGGERKSADGEGESSSLINKDQALSFLQKYGARPYYEEAPMVRSPYFEAFLAYQTFMLLWSRQFLTGFTFTYMPELFPGGIVSFPSHGIQCYIDEVEHTGDYTSGFTTRANLSAPSAITTKDGTGKVLRSGRSNAYEGMIRANALNIVPNDKPK